MEWKAQRKSEMKVEDKGEPEEAVARIEAGGRRKEIANDNTASTEKSGLFLFRHNETIHSSVYKNINNL